MLAFAAVCLAALSFSQASALARQGDALPIQTPQAAATPGSVLPEDVKRDEEAKLDVLSARHDTQWNRYRAAYFACVVGAAMLSGLAGLLLQLNSTKDRPRIKDVATVLSFASAFLITVNTLTGFNTAAFANRGARNAIRQLKVQVLKDEITNRGEIEARKMEIEAKKGDGATGRS